MITYIRDFITDSRFARQLFPYVDCWRTIWNVAISIPPVTVIEGNRSSTPGVSLGDRRTNPGRQVYRTTDFYTIKVKGKVHTLTCHVGIERGCRGITLLFFNLGDVLG